MIEVRMMLHDHQELALVHSLVMKLEDRRKDWSENRNRCLPPESLAPIPEPLPVVKDDGDRGPGSSQQPNPLPATPPYAQLETSLRGYLTRHGPAKALALLTTFGAPRLSEVYREKHAELFAELQK